MGEHTPTNEETLVQILAGLGSDEEVLLCASSEVISMVEVYVLPLGWTTYGFKEQYGRYFWKSEEFNKKYHRTTMLSIAMHKDVWLSFGDASKYR